MPNLTGKIVRIERLLYIDLPTIDAAAHSYSKKDLRHLKPSMLSSDAVPGAIQSGEWVFCTARPQAPLGEQYKQRWVFSAAALQQGNQNLFKRAEQRFPELTTVAQIDEAEAVLVEVDAEKARVLAEHKDDMIWQLRNLFIAPRAYYPNGHHGGPLNAVSRGQVNASDEITQAVLNDIEIETRQHQYTENKPTMYCACSEVDYLKKRFPHYQFSNNEVAKFSTWQSKYHDNHSNVAFYQWLTATVPEEAPKPNIAPDGTPRVQRWVKVKLVDEQGNAIPNSHFSLYPPNSRKSVIATGVTDKTGLSERISLGHIFEKIDVVFAENNSEKQEHKQSSKIDWTDKMIEVPVERFGPAVELSVFFDGTANNSSNAERGEDCRAETKANPEEQNLGESIVALCEEYETEGSYSNEATNIQKLFDLAKINSEGNRFMVPIYVAGVGTVTGEPDAPIGLGLGRGDTGVLAQFKKAIQTISDDFFGDAEISNKPLHRLTLNIFGFSRGAATARHFANDLLKGAKGELAQALAEGGITFDDATDWPNADNAGDPKQKIHTRFIGLFDTVAAVGSLGDGLDTTDENNKDINVYLPPGAAKKIVHLTAIDEYRANFALNALYGKAGPDAAPNVKEVFLPGAHSDIGGGYRSSMQETLLVTRPQVETYHDEPPIDLKKSDLMAKMAALNNEHQNKIWGGSSEVVHRIDEVGKKQRLIASIKMTRSVQGGLSRIPLRIMRRLAADQGVPFRPIDANKALLKLPDELTDIYHALLHHAQSNEPGTKPNLRAEDAELLYKNYIHHSAHWHGLFSLGSPELSLSSPALFYPMRPNSERTVHLNEQPEAYPV